MLTRKNPGNCSALSSGPIAVVDLLIIESPRDLGTDVTVVAPSGSPVEHYYSILERTDRDDITTLDCDFM